MTLTFNNNTYNKAMWLSLETLNVKTKHRLQNVKKNLCSMMHENERFLSAVEKAADFLLYSPLD